jgi:hypothetical protein
MRKILFMFLIFLLAGISYAGDTDKPPAGYEGLVVERPKLNKGDRWEYARRDKIISYELVEKKNGELVFHLQWDEWKSEGKKETEIRTPDLNVMKIIDIYNEIEEISPYRGTLSFPLWVGKKWSYSFSTTKRVKRGVPGTVTEDADVKVVSYEQVKVPAGTFWAFKIEEKRQTRGAKGPRGRLGYYITIWYSPEIKFTVKVEHDNDVYNRELVKYTIGN